MTDRLRPLERAFQLARTGAYRGVSDIREQLIAEGYAVDQLYGPSIGRDLRRISREARLAADAQPGEGESLTAS